MNGFRSGKVYLRQLLALIYGQTPLTLDSYRPTPKKLDGWSDEDLDALIEEGRRQLDSHHTRLDNVQSRAQFLFAIGMVLIGLVLSAFGTNGGTFSDGLAYFVAAALILYGTLGFASVVAVNAEFEMIDAAKLSTYQPPVKLRLARDYSEMMARGENSLNTKLMMLRHSVVWTIVGGSIALAQWTWG